MSSNNKLTFCTGVGTVTGANFLLDTAVDSRVVGDKSVTGTRLLIDCGLVQGEKVALDENSEPFAYDLSSVAALIITHAHLDHVGRIPKLVKDGYHGPIYSTPETRSLAELVLNDAVTILRMEAERDGRVPLYTPEDVAKVFPLWKTIPYHENFKISDDVSIFLKDAGHILGSAMVEVTVAGAQGSGGAQKFLFTGDLGNSPAPLLRDTEPVGDVDYMVMESVYGDRNHESRAERSDKFERIIKQTISRGGTLVIPTFAIDRTQVILYELNNLVENKKIPSVIVYVDSPMATEATRIYAESQDLFNDYVKTQIAHGDKPFSFPHLQFTSSQMQSSNIESNKDAKIILAGSGMSMGGRVIGHEEFYLPDEKSTILLVGYQMSGSLGRHLVDGEKTVQIHGRPVHVKATIETIFGFSAHKDSDHLVEFVSTATPRLKEVFVVMGEPKASMHLAQRINDEIGKKAIVPERLKVYELE